MWIILIFACVSVILPNNAQELTSFETQTVTETYVNGGANRDSPRPAVTLRILNGRTHNINRENTENSDSPVYYSNQWQPILMPIRFNNNRNSQIYVNENEPSTEQQLVPTFLRRPYSEGNYTVPYIYSQIEETDEFSGTNVQYQPVPYLQKNFNITSDSLTNIADQIYPETLHRESISRKIDNFQPFDLYRNSFIPPATPAYSASQSSFDSNVEKFNINTEQKQLPLTAVPESMNADSLTSRIKEESSISSVTDTLHAGEETSKPVNFYRNIQRYFPPMAPAYIMPNIYPPFQRNGPFRPIVPYPSNVPSFDREAGSEVDESIQNIPVKRRLPGEVEQNIPIATSSNIPPPRSIPLPAASGYPFGLYSPSFISPFIPNIPQSGFPLIPVPLSQARNVQRGNAFTSLRSSPVIPLTPGPEVVSEVLSQRDNLTPEGETTVISNSEVNPEETVFVEEQNRTKIPYEFGFNMNDGKGNDQHRNEVSDISGVVTGSYGFNNKGIYREVKYIADENGFRAYILSNEPGVASSGSASVVVMAEKPPMREITKTETETEIIPVPDANTHVTEPGSILESK